MRITHLSFIRKGKFVAIIAIGIDLAKNVFAVHGVDATGKAVLVRAAVRRDALLELIAKLPPCLIGMEACSGVHHWARQFQQFGHTVRIMAAKFVAPYRLSICRVRQGSSSSARLHCGNCEDVSQPAARPSKSVVCQCH